MKILQVVHYFVLDGLGGSELYTHNLSSRLKKRHNVRLFFTIPADGNEGEVVRGDHNGIAYWALKKQRLSYAHPCADRSKLVEKAFAGVLEEFKPDVVHFQHLINLSFALPSLVKKHGIACCFTLHDYWFICPRTKLLTDDLKICSTRSPSSCRDCLRNQIGYYDTRNSTGGLLPLLKQPIKKLLNAIKSITLLLNLSFWRTYWVRNVFRNVDMFIAPSRFLLEQYVGIGLPREKITFCRHGFITFDCNGYRKKTSPHMRFAFLGTLNVHKGIYLLIDAFNSIPGPAELKIYGRLSPAMKQSLEKRITNPLISLMGELAEQDKATAFSDIDVLILPSICYENCPLTINEAFMAKVPVITGNIGGMAELVEDGKTGLLFPVGSADKLAEKINVCINDPDLVHRLSSNIAPVKDMGTHVDEIERLYEKIRGR